ncbi:MAG: NUDIX domain-containing protein [Defluviitaleaceae bacterium]|nr:NUDIX domain-containing protein [Defluviitaleaceae bacterium]
MRRALECDWLPGIWSAPGGCAISGESSLVATVREVKEEVGIHLNPKNGELFCSYRADSAFFDHWLFKEEYDIACAVLQESESMDVKSASWDEIARMKENGSFMGKRHFGVNFDAFDLLKSYAA